MKTIIETLIRTIIGFTVLLFLLRILGKKQLGQATFFTYVTGIALGNIAGDMVVHRDIKLVDGVTGLTVWAVMTFIVEFVSLKSAKARVILDGEPTIVIKKSEIMEEALAGQRMNMDDLSMLLRNNNVFSIKEVEYAILEPNGQLSVLRKPGLEPVSKQDMQIPVNGRQYMPTEIIADGKLVARNMKELGLNEEWLRQQLVSSGVKSMDEVLFAELQSDGSLYISKRKAGRSK